MTGQSQRSLGESIHSVERERGTKKGHPVYSNYDKNLLTNFFLITSQL
jgi:hypothetical protein